MRKNWALTVLLLVGVVAGFSLIKSVSLPHPIQAAFQDNSDPDPLPSWNNGKAKKAILEFVRATTDPKSPDFVPPEERLIAFDNDGTLWVEQPLYTEVAFVVDKVKALAATTKPEWKTQEPYKAILENNKEMLAQVSIGELAKILSSTHAGMTEAEFHAEAQDWLAKARHPKFQRPYTELVYQPMLEVLQFFRANGFKTYMVTAGRIEFVRAFCNRVYGIPPEQVVASTNKLKYEIRGGRPVLIRLADMLLLDDGPGKPEFIYLFIGRRPTGAFGNSVGDQQMLEWTQAGKGKRLMMLVHHDDKEREYAYGPNSKIGTFPEKLMTEARERAWTVISMKEDWNRIFPFSEKK